MKPILLLSVGCLVCNVLLGQTKTTTTVKSKLEKQVVDANDNGDLMTEVGLNVLLTRRALNYLTGSSDAAPAKFYAAYTTDNDKLNLGFNFPVNDRYTKSLSLIVNPIFEADVKNDFTTLYKDSVWKNNIRIGLKLSYFFGIGKLSYWPNNAGPTEQRYLNDMQILRAKKLDELKKKLDEAETTRSKSESVPFTGAAQSISPGTHSTAFEQKLKRKEKEYLSELGKAEAEFVDQEGAYTKMQAAWISAWGFMPISKQEYYVTPIATQLFSKTRYKFWEINIQATGFIEWRESGAFYGSLWLRRFQNNSVNASLITAVDYGQYAVLPGSNPINMALLETNKAYIGEYKEFMTSTLNLQFLWLAPIHNSLLRPGLSFRIEKNTGEYDATDLRFGLPLNIQGKDKVITVELQYRLNNVNNYKDVVDHKPTKILGLGLGFPIALLYK